MIAFTLNGREVQLEVDPEMPLLWALRERTGLTGTKFGCGIGACGACTVLIDGVPVRTCITMIRDVEGRAVTTIEGLAGEDPETLHPVQEAWIEHQVPQCGYCQSGVILAVAALLERSPTPTEAEVDETITNLCRCGTYVRMRRAIASLVAGEGTGLREESPA